MIGTNRTDGLKVYILLLWGTARCRCCIAIISSSLTACISTIISAGYSSTGISSRVAFSLLYFTTGSSITKGQSVIQPTMTPTPLRRHFVSMFRWQRLSLFFHRVVVEMTTTLFEVRKALRELDCVVPKGLTSWILQLFVCFTLTFFGNVKGI